MYLWKVLAQYDDNKSVVNTILENRGIVSRKEKDIFVKPPPLTYWFERLPKTLLRSIREARELIEENMSADRAIVVHGDYDADGVCATAILYKTLRHELNYENSYSFIPNRFDHGYGFSTKSIESVIERLPKEEVEKGILFITVDCGITSVEEVEYLNKNGHSVIITDHHQKSKSIPQASGVVWYDQVVGATLSYLLSSALGAKNKDFIAYCAVATITDLQQVLGFNRTIVKEGLDIINRKPPLGIESLIEVAGKRNMEVTAYDLGWIVGPRLNATGRVEDASYALDLLVEEDPEKSKKLAWRLNKVNTQRQDKTLEMYELAAEMEEETLPGIIISHHDNYHEGIIGLVASRLSKKYNRPAVVISTSQEIAKGSVRSIKGVNIIETLREMEELFVSLGGHPMAAGFSIHRDKINSLRDRLKEYAKENISEEMLIRRMEVDMEIPINIIN